MSCVKLLQLNFICMSFSFSSFYFIFSSTKQLKNSSHFIFFIFYSFYFLYFLACSCSQLCFEAYSITSPNIQRCIKPLLFCLMPFPCSKFKSILDSFHISYLISKGNNIFLCNQIDRTTAIQTTHDSLFGFFPVMLPRCCQKWSIQSTGCCTRFP